MERRAQRGPSFAISGRIRHALVILRWAWRGACLRDAVLLALSLSYPVPIMIGTIANTAAIIIGSLTGGLVKHGLKEKEIMVEQEIQEVKIMEQMEQEDC